MKKTDKRPLKEATSTSSNKGKRLSGKRSGFISQLKLGMGHTPQAQEMAQLQAGADNYTAQLKKERETSGKGLDSSLASGVEQEFAKETGKSVSLAGTKVVKNSSKPGEMNAHAVAQNKEVHTAPGQEKHTGHELTHILQQKAGMVKPTTTVNGTPVNDDKGLEKQADRIGDKAKKYKGGASSTPLQPKMKTGQPLQQKAMEVPIVQRKELASKKLNVAGEFHGESELRRDRETEYTQEKLGSSAVYRRESEFKTKTSVLSSERYGDPRMLRAEMLLAIVKTTIMGPLADISNGVVDVELFGDDTAQEAWVEAYKQIEIKFKGVMSAVIAAIEDDTETDQGEKGKSTLRAISVWAKQANALKAPIGDLVAGTKGEIETKVIPGLNVIFKTFAKDVLGLDDIREEDEVSALRSKAMQQAATDDSSRWINWQEGVWKVGNAHVAEMAKDKDTDKYELMSREEFNKGYDKWALTKGYPVTEADTDSEDDADSEAEHKE